MSTEPTPGERLAATLRRSPIHVDPSLAAALPRADRRRLLARFRRAPVPIFVILVPLVKGGTWSDAEQLATVVHDRLGRHGVFVTFSATSPDSLDAHEWGGDHDAHDAAWAVNFDRALDDASLADKLARFADLIISGTAAQAYKKASDEIDRRYKAGQSARAGAARQDGGGGGRDDGRDDGGPGLVAPLTAGGAVVAAVAGLAVWRRRRMAAVRRAGHRLLLPRKVFATAGRADEEELRGHAARELVTFGELLDESALETSDEKVRGLMSRALDAYQAAGKVLDSAHGVADLAGVLVLVDQGRDALACAQARADGDAEPAPSPLCFFNPLHGDSVKTVNWRPIGTRRKLRVAICATCARAVRDRETPEMLTERDDGREVPYFEVDPERSVWAETGYGQFRADLAQRVLRGDLRRR